MPDAFTNTRDLLHRTRHEMATALAGQTDLIDGLMLSLIAGGQTYIDGLPGSGKTTAARALAAVFSLRFTKITCTEDLLPEDLTGTLISTEDTRGRRHTTLDKGPLFGQLVFLDRFDRAPGRTQRIVLDAVEEQTVHVKGRKVTLEPPWLVIATSNPYASDYTRPLTEDALDRFMFTMVAQRADAARSVAILSRTTGPEPAPPQPTANVTAVLAAQALCRSVAVTPSMLEHITDLLRLCDPLDPECHPRARAMFRSGPGIRAARHLVLATKASALSRGSSEATYQDLARVVRSTIRHRVSLTNEAASQGAHPELVLEEILRSITVDQKNIYAPATNT